MTQRGKVYGYLGRGGEQVGAPPPRHIAPPIKPDPDLMQRHDEREPVPWWAPIVVAVFVGLCWGLCS